MVKGKELWDENFQKKNFYNTDDNVDTLMLRFPNGSLIEILKNKLFFFLLLFVTFKVYRNLHLSRKFHWISSRRSKDKKIYFFSCNYFRQFLDFFFLIPLLQKN